MQMRKNLSVENHKEDSPIETIYLADREVHIYCKGSGYDYEIECFLRSKFPNKASAIYFWGDDEEMGIWCSAEHKEVLLALGYKYLSLSVFEKLGFTNKRELQRAGFYPSATDLQRTGFCPSLLQICANTVEKAYWEHTLFWDRIKSLPQEVKDYLPSLVDTEEQLKDKYEGHEMSKELYDNSHFEELKIIEAENFQRTGFCSSLFKKCSNDVKKSYWPQVLEKQKTKKQLKAQYEGHEISKELYNYYYHRKNRN